MYYIKIKDNLPQGSPLTLQQMQSIFPNANGPEDFVGYKEFKYTNQPPPPKFFKCVELAPVLREDGIVYQTWGTEEISPEEKNEMTTLEIQKVRLLRHSELIQSDWTQFRDSPLPIDKQIEYALYRQQLRDIPAQAGFPWDVTWPTKPL